MEPTIELNLDTGTAIVQSRRTLYDADGNEVQGTTHRETYELGKDFSAEPAEVQDAITRMRTPERLARIEAAAELEAVEFKER